MKSTLQKSALVLISLAVTLSVAELVSRFFWQATSTHVVDTAGNLTSMTDGSGNTTSYEYDIHGNLIRIAQPQLPLNRETRYEYDEFDRKTKIIDANSHVARYTYDNADRLAQYDIIVDSGAGETISWTAEYDAHGNTTRETDAS